MKLFQYFSFALLLVAFSSCDKDEARTCTQCRSSQTDSFELCQETDGNASVNGENTGTDYDTYFEGLIASGANCGG